jgi:phosphopantothenoylcysteine decarboxylase/phosphopantothenate--cysteine ligase
MFADSAAGELHVSLAEQSDAIVLVPATADLIARIASGRADDLLTATILCASCPILAAPAMHPTMWAHPATQRNVATIEADGRVDFVGPVEGEVASGDHGQGRMAEPEDLVDALVARLTTRDLLGRHIVVTAGPTVEDLDPVRFVSNRSSGKMGFALARRAAARGARVTLIAGPVTLTTPYGVQRVDVRSAIAMRGAIWQALGPDLSNADALLMAAAVGDYRPAETRAAKLKRGDQPLALELVQNPDLLAEIGDSREGTRPVLVGFAVETGSDPAIVEYATDKLHKKRVDLVVANHAEESLGRDDNRVTLVSREGAEPSDAAPKGEVADRILDWVVSRVATGE